MKHGFHPQLGPPNHHLLAQLPGISVPGTPGSSHSSITRSSDEESSWAVVGLRNVDLSPALGGKLLFILFIPFVVFPLKQNEQRMNTSSQIQLCSYCFLVGWMCCGYTTAFHDLPAQNR